MSKLSALVLFAASLAAAREVTYSQYSGTACTGEPATYVKFDSGSYTYCVNVYSAQDYSIDVDCSSDTIKVRYYDELSCEGSVTTQEYALDTCITTSSGGFFNVSTSEYFTCDDDPCFARESTYACKLTDAAVPAEAAFESCFGERAGPHAERVLMASLRAGDVVLSEAAGKPAATRVVVNQHVHVEHQSLLMHLHHATGTLSVTPDHVLYLDGAFVPARLAKSGSALADVNLGHVEIERVSYSRGGIINPITASGKILAAAADGLPVLASTGNEWLADVMLSAYPQYTLSYALAAAFPETVQSFYNAALEPFFTTAVPLLAKAKAAAPMPVVAASLVLGDVMLAAGLAIYAMATIEVLLVIAGVAFFAKARSAKA